MPGGSTNADGPVTDVPVEEFWAKMRVDLFGTFLALKFVLPEMISHGGGSVINMVSIAGFGNLTGDRSAYASAKAAVMTLTRSTARTFVGKHVRVNGIAPAAVATDRVKAMLHDRPEIQDILAVQQLGLIEPDDVANAALFLASDESRMRITGHILPIDAGALAD